MKLLPIYLLLIPTLLFGFTSEPSKIIELSEDSIILLVNGQVKKLNKEIRKNNAYIEVYQGEKQLQIIRLRRSGKYELNATFVTSELIQLHYKCDGFTTKIIEFDISGALQKNHPNGLDTYPTDIDLFKPKSEDGSLILDSYTVAKFKYDDEYKSFVLDR
jgi:hypothetical protein